MNAKQRRLKARAQARESKSDVVLASYGRPIMLAAAVGELTESSGPVWVECCLSGTYLGHPNAKRLDWGPQLFQTLIDNLHKNPSYRAGPDGVGASPVIPWDYEHASEIAKINQSFPPGGLPAEAWTYEMQVRPGADGNPALFALTEFLPQALGQIRSKQYRWCSIAVTPNFIDPVSGQNQGATVTSIALTNDPFIQGMVPLAATRNGATVTQTLDQWGPAESIEEALIGLRKIFELEDSAPAADVLAQIQTLRGLIQSGTVPEYLGVTNVLDRMRRLLELPLLSLPMDVLGGAEAVVNQLLAGGVTADPSATSSEGTEAMSANTLNVALASRWNCGNDDASILLAAAKMDEKVKCANEATSAFDQLKGMLGGEDMASVVANCTKMVADAKQLGPVLEALNAAHTAMKGTAEADAANEADLVAASISRGDEAFKNQVKPVILAARVACFDQKTGIVDPAKLEKFRKDYPLPEEQTALLTRRVVAAPGGTQLGGPATGYQTQPIMQSNGAGGATPGGADAQVQKIVEAINAQEGPNPQAKANALLCSRSPAHKNLPWAEQCRVAGEFTRTVMAGKVPAGFTL